MFNIEFMSTVRLNSMDEYGVFFFDTNGFYVFQERIFKIDNFMDLKSQHILFIDCKTKFRFCRPINVQACLRYLNLKIALVYLLVLNKAI